MRLRTLLMRAYSPRFAHSEVSGPCARSTRLFPGKQRTDEHDANHKAEAYL
jgi:hypothetical protein